MGFRDLIKIRRRKIIIMSIIAILSCLIITQFLHTIFVWSYLRQVIRNMEETQKNYLRSLILENKLEPETKRNMFSYIDLPHFDQKNFDEFDFYFRSLSIINCLLCGAIIFFCIGFMKAGNLDTMISEMGKHSKLNLLGKLQEDLKK